MQNLYSSTRILLLASLMIFILLGCGGGGTTPSIKDTNPPVWDDTIGVTKVVPGDGSVTMFWGTATDPEGSNPVRYRVFWIDETATGSTDPFGGWPHGVVEYVDSPYTVENLINGHKYWFGVRCEDSSAVGDEDNNANKNTVTLSAVPSSQNKFVMFDNVHFIEETNLTLNNRNGMNLTYDYSGTPPSINIGGVLISNSGGGYLYNVETIQDTGSQIVVDISQATFADAFESANFSGTADFSGTGSSAAFHRELNTQDGGNYFSDPVVVDLAGTPLYNIGSTSIMISKGSLILEPIIQYFYIWEDMELKDFAFQVTGNVTFDCTLSLTTGVGYASDIPPKVIFSKMIPFAAGPVGMLAKFKVEVGLDISGNVQGTVTTGMCIEKTFAIGAQQWEDEIEPILDTSDAVYTPYKPTAEAEGEFVLRTYLRPEVSMWIAGVIGPGVDFEPYLEFDADGELLPEPCIEYELTAGIASHVLVKLGIFGIEMPGTEDWKWKVFDLKPNEPLLEGDYPECCSNKPPEWDDAVGVQSVEQDGNSVTVSWGTAHDPDEPPNDPVKYNLYYVDETYTKDSNPFKSPNAKIENVTSPYTFTNLSSNHIYWFGVRAQDTREKKDGEDCSKEEENEVKLSSRTDVVIDVTSHPNGKIVDSYNVVIHGEFLNGGGQVDKLEILHGSETFIANIQPNNLFNASVNLKQGINKLNFITYELDQNLEYVESVSFMVYEDKNFKLRKAGPGSDVITLSSDPGDINVAFVYGMAIDPIGEVWIEYCSGYSSSMGGSCDSYYVNKYDMNFNLLLQEPGYSINHMLFDSDGNIYFIANENSSGCVKQYDSDMSFLNTIITINPPPAKDHIMLQSIVFDSVGDLYISYRTFILSGWSEIDVEYYLDKYDSDFELIIHKEVDRYHYSDHYNAMLAVSPGDKINAAFQDANRNVHIVRFDSNLNLQDTVLTITSPSTDVYIGLYGMVFNSIGDIYLSYLTCRWDIAGCHDFKYFLELYNSSFGMEIKVEIDSPRYEMEIDPNDNIYLVENWRPYDYRGFVVQCPFNGTRAVFP